MTTLPRTSILSSKQTFTPPTISNYFFSQLTRPRSEFDAGLNTSNAWTEHLEHASGSLSDEEPEDDQVDLSDEKGRPARALYQFEGKVEFRELNVEAGDEIGVVKEELSDGWSLVRNTAGEVGLLPRTYYTFTADFTTAPSIELPPAQPQKRETSTSSLTPHASPTSNTEILPIIPQNTGEWSAFPSFRHSLLGGKSLNRFSSFVTSGAEAWVLKGSASDTTPGHKHEKSSSEVSEDGGDEHNLSRLGAGEADRHYVDVGPIWKTKLPPFRVLIHSPSKRASTISGAYTVYSVTSLFNPSQDGVGSDLDSEHDGEFLTPLSPTRITVHRRFSHFVMLHTALSRRLPGIVLPPLPEKQYAGRFSHDFVEARRGDLERYIDRIVRHPVARYAEVVMFFLGCESDLEWKRQLPHHQSLPPVGTSFYAHVFHPAFNVDADDAVEASDRFDSHTRAVGKGVQGLRNIFRQVREARIGMSQAERLLSYSLLSLITSKPLLSAPMTGISEDEQETNGSKGLLNRDNAWCWREECEDCLKLTKAMQKTAETMQNVADLYDDHARRTQLATHESLKGLAHPHSMYEPVIEIHRSALSRYNEATREGYADEEMAARCETVLNTTMAEMDTYHSQKIEDFTTTTKEHLDGEIIFYEQVLSKLRTARKAFDSPQYDESGKTPRQPSFYERELENPRLTNVPLPQPCPHVYDSAPMRPVSVAIQGGVGMLLGGSNSGSGSAGRASMFGKFW